MLKTAMIFGNGMVLQKKKEIVIWGTSEANAWVAVTLGHEQNSCMAQSDGTWRVVFPPRDTARNLHMYVTDGVTTIHYSDICIGEVWLVGGQSGKDHPLSEDQEFIREMTEDSDIRFFHFPEESSPVSEKTEDFPEKDGSWQKACISSAGCVSAAGYHFAGKIKENRSGCVGIVECTKKDASIGCWIDPEFLKNTEGSILLEDYEKSLAEGNDEESLTGKKPGAFYEQILKQVAPLGVRGVLWYQSEQDADYSHVYGTLFRKLIENWRMLWKEDLPFLYAQFAPTCSETGKEIGHYTVLRQQQELVSKMVPGVWMISSSDCRTYPDMDPRANRRIGERLAVTARNHVYGEEIDCSVPEIQNAYLMGENVILIFRNGEGLYVEGAEINDLDVYDKNGKAITFSAYDCEYNVLILKNCRNAEKISLAARDDYQVNIYNKAGMPAKPFQVLIS